MENQANEMPGYGHRRSAPPEWLVPVSNEVCNHIGVEHLRRCAVTVHDLIEFECPCEPPRLMFLACTSCTRTVLVVAGGTCEHLEQFVEDGVPVRWAT